jgi:hypothetical protein
MHEPIDPVAAGEGVLRAWASLATSRMQLHDVAIVHLVLASDMLTALS